MVVRKCIEKRQDWDTSLLSSLISSVDIRTFSCIGFFFLCFFFSLILFYFIFFWSYCEVYICSVSQLLLISFDVRSFWCYGLILLRFFLVYWKFFIGMEGIWLRVKGFVGFEVRSFKESEMYALKCFCLHVFSVHILCGKSSEECDT